MRSRSRTLPALVGLVCGVVLLASCATTLQGRAVSVFADPFSVAGMPATDGPSGLRPGAPGPQRTIRGSDGGAPDRLAGTAIDDIEQFWKASYPGAFGGDFTPAQALVSWDSGGYDGSFCGEDTTGLVNAAYCYPDRTIGWDRGQLVPSLRQAHGDMGVVMVLAHEYGHAVARQAGLSSKGTRTLVAEQQADCLAGAYLRWVAEDNSPRFSLNTGNGLNTVLAGVVAFRDPLLAEGDPQAGRDEHGSAFERVSAFQFGFTDGPSACASIDLREINQRRGNLPVLLPENQTGELPIDRDSVRSIVDAMGILFPLDAPPTLSVDAGAAARCPDARPSPAASYCPATNTLAVDLPKLAELGAPDESADGGSLAAGDNVAYSILVSRYMQALQHERGGVALDSAQAALRTACLTGVATVKMSKDVTTPDGRTIALTAGDVDEAVSGMLTNGLAASDVNGESVPSGFSRIDAFRVGVLGDTDRCFARFR